ncbi:MAG: hypothetical protein P8L68_06490 [Paracoccaceae bacterium]|nr:hypothetical protein [Paracoccaceae bacterium]MDG2258122.1 hypothetical protein [Paracoccaceae bacterium]
MSAVQPQTSLSPNPSNDYHRDIGEAQRLEIYQQLRVWLTEPVGQSVLTQVDVERLIAFLGTLEYSAVRKVESP